MPKKENIRKLLGLTQEMLAIELQITRSQLSMYELGKRDLQANAKLKLSDMLTDIKKLRSHESNISIEQHQILINDFLFVNQRKSINLENVTLTLSNKLKKLENKSLLNKDSINKPLDLEKLKLEILKLSIKKELLNEEKNYLETKLKNL